MAERQDIDFILGSTWIISMVCKDVSGAIIDLVGTNADVQFRLAGDTLLLDLATGSGVTIDQTDPPTGIAIITITPEMQTTAGVPSGVLNYEARVLLGDDTVSDQAYGTCYVRESLFNLVP